MKPQFDETLLQDLDSFIKYYEFIDVEKIYTNGSELIQVSRIKQWFAYNNNKQKQLEEENKKLKEENKRLNLAMQDTYDSANDICGELQQRINKAIEYINENVAVYAFGNKELPSWEFNDNNIFELLNILKGSEE